MLIKYKWAKPWYSCHPKEQFWAYYDSASCCYFCFASYGRQEYQGESAYSYDNAYARLASQVNVPPMERFSVYYPETLKTNGVDILNI